LFLLQTFFVCSKFFTKQETNLNSISKLLNPKVPKVELQMIKVFLHELAAFLSIQTNAEIEKYFKLKKFF